MVSQQKYFLLNLPTFNSVNLASLFSTMGVFAGLNNYEARWIALKNAQAGYTVSAAYPQLNIFYPEASFVLLKEDIGTIETHLTYGFYHEMYDKKTIYDFQKYFGITFQNGIIPGLDTIVKNYYAKVIGLLGASANFTVLDMSTMNGSWSSLMNSQLFYSWINSVNLPSDVRTRLNTPIGLAQVVGRKYMNYLIGGPSSDTPTNYLMGGVYIDGFIKLSGDVRTPGYVDNLLLGIK